MRPPPIIAVPFAALLALSSAPLPAAAPANSLPPPGPALTKALAGRTPGKPLTCINLPAIGSSTSLAEGAIIYKQSSRLWYVNRPDDGRCTLLRRDRAIATRTPSTQLCRGDIVRVFDPVGHFDYGACGLGDFVPYTK